MTRPSAIFVVDDDALSRESVCELARSMGLEAHEYASAESFLDNHPDQPGCVISDLLLPGMNGVELLEELAHRRVEIPLILLTAHAHTAMVVRALKAGAVTVLEKPCDFNQLWDAMREALELDSRRRERRRQHAELEQRLARLTEKEHDVMRMIVAGKANKIIAAKLGASIRTVENRRRNVFTKLGVRSVAELVALVLKSRERPWGRRDSPEDSGIRKLGPAFSKH